MKQRQLIKNLIRQGCCFVRHGKNHDIYVNTKNGKKAPIPGHAEIKDTLIMQIKKQLGL